MALKNAPSQKAKRKVGEEKPEKPAKKAKVGSEATKGLQKIAQGADAKCVKNLLINLLHLVGY
jgi:hypothetical protein